MKNLLLKTTGLFAAFALCTGTVLADWALNKDNSSLHFASTKKEVASEIHSFDKLSGSITEAGQATLGVDLASVNTKIDIRNQRLLKHFFETDKFPTAAITLDLGEDGVKVGAREVSAKLNLHGVEKDLSANVMVMDGGETLTVFTVAPVMLSTDDFALDGGLEMLKKLAQLTSINKAVPVTFMLSFDKQ